MAKTFKNIARTEPVAQKRVSERDFFDLTDEPALTSPSLPIPNHINNTRNTGVSSNKGNTSNTVTGGNTSNNVQVNESAGNTGNTRNKRNATMPDSDGTIAPAAAVGDIRQTFVLSRHHLEQLRDYVHARRAQGDYTYSQKQALQEALTLLFAEAAPAQPRPAQVREREQQHRQRIQQGRQASSNE